MQVSGNVRFIKYTSVEIGILSNTVYKNIERHTVDTIVSWPNPK